MLQAYEVSRDAVQASTFGRDLSDVRAAVRTILKEERYRARVYLVAVDTTKASIVQLLNGGEIERKRIRGWRVTVRGALVELTPEQLAEEAAE